MTVGELVAQLSGYAREMRVVVDGYEGGYDDPTLLPEYVSLDRGGIPYMGQHDEGDATDANATMCLVVSRRDR